jgi:hypothetical protein
MGTYTLITCNFEPSAFQEVILRNACASGLMQMGGQRISSPLSKIAYSTVGAGSTHHYKFLSCQAQEICWYDYLPQRPRGYEALVDLVEGWSTNHAAER